MLIVDALLVVVVCVDQITGSVHAQSADNTQHEYSRAKEAFFFVSKLVVGQYAAEEDRHETGAETPRPKRDHISFELIHSAAVAAEASFFSKMLR